MVPFLAITALLVSLADHWTTWLCLRSPVAGWEVAEANPLAAWLFQAAGLGGGLLLDSAVTLAAVLLLVRTRRLPEAVKQLLLCTMIFLTAYAVANNLEAIFQIGLSPIASRAS